MDLSSLAKVPDEQTVEEYVSIFEKIDWMTAVTAILILVIGFLLVRLVLKWTGKAMQKSRLPKTMHSMVRTLLRILLDLVVILTAAGFIGIPITSFIALLSLAGLAIAMALQNIIGNLAGGFLILMNKPFEVGHFVEHDGVTGTVREIRMQNTRVETMDGRMVYIPNKSISEARVINYTETGKRRVEISVSASYDNSPDEVRAAVMDAIGKTANILPDPAPAVILDGYGDSSISYWIYVWVNSVNFLPVKYELTERLYAAFAQHQVEMTYPHLNLHMK